uniref:Uncharacterized protein n=2 Tax=Theileria parva TaxID=5875 RepID=Q4MZ57_THEPA|eukprot:XP_762758.1 hypothetical protein [Theileria parva strain Muguga]
MQGADLVDPNTGELDEQLRNVRFPVTYYQSKTDVCIHKVYYHGVEIYSNIPNYNSFTIDGEHFAFVRTVSLGQLSGKMFLCIYNQVKTGNQTRKTMEKIYTLVDETIQSIMDIQHQYMSLGSDEYMPLEVRVIKNILTREPSKLKDYGDLDEVDGEPYLLRGNKNISPKQIKREIEKIMKNPNIGEADLREADPSGLSTVVESDVMDWTNADSDSDDDTIIYYFDNN